MLRLFTPVEVLSGTIIQPVSLRVEPRRGSYYTCAYFDLNGCMVKFEGDPLPVGERSPVEQLFRQGEFVAVAGQQQLNGQLEAIAIYVSISNRTVGEGGRNAEFGFAALIVMTCSFAWLASQTNLPIRRAVTLWIMCVGMPGLLALLAASVIYINRKAWRMAEAVGRSGSVLCKDQLAHNS